MDLLNLDDYRRAAARELARMTFDYYASGADEQLTVDANRRAFRRLGLRYRVLRDVSRRDLSVELLGQQLAFPVLVAPTAFHGLAHPDGEVATAAAAGAAGTVMTLSTLSNRPVEEVAGVSAGPVWFQLYVYRDREVTEGLVRRAEDAGCVALVLTVDAPVLGRREADVRNRFHLPDDLPVANLTGDRERMPEAVADSGLAAYVDAMFDPGLDWDDLTWLVELTGLPVLVKGIVHPEDARRAVEHGAAGVWVSNHGGRQLDTAPATALCLPDVVAAVDGRVPVILDGGIRRGTDVVKAVALGASAVAVGRPVLWGLAVGGRDGAERVLEILREETDRGLALCGMPSVERLRREGGDLVQKTRA